jgi:hypothetical protein
MDWTVTEDCNWLTLDSNSGTSSGEVDDVNVIVDINGLVEGTYNCQLTVTGSGAPNSPQIVDVNLIVIGPLIGVNFTAFHFIADEGGSNPADQVLSISNIGGGTLNWQITEDCNWLSVEPNSGSSTGEVVDVNLSVDITGLGGGTYNCQLTVSDSNALNSPQVVDVNLYRLVSWWKFDEGSGGTAYDSAGGNDGTLNSYPSWVTGKIGGALEFDGSNDYVDLGNDNSLKRPLPVTVSAWIKLSESGGPVQKIISIDEQAPTYYGIWLQVDLLDTILVGYGNGGGNGWGNRREKDGTTSLDQGTWYHVAAVIRGYSGGMAIYINGTDDGGSYSGNARGVVYSSGNSSIGCTNSGLKCLGGVIDDVRIYDRALTAGEIAQLYEDGLGDKAFDPEPVDGTSGIGTNVVLSWTSGLHAASHDVYFGTDYNYVNDAMTGSAEYMGNQGPNTFDTANYDANGLGYETTYYWRIDEVNVLDSNSPWKGNVWSFETGRPVIELSTTQFEFTTIEGGANPTGQILSISNIGAGTLNWEITETCDWLTVVPGSGSSSGEVDGVNLSVDISGLARGIYNCNLIVSDPNAGNSPQGVGVRLVVGIGGELYVPSGYSTIQGAIDAAVNGNTVIILSGTYTGAGNKNLDFGGRAITVRSLDPEDPSVVAATVIDCQNSGRGFYFHSDEGPNSVVSGLTITRGRTGRGGGIYCNSTSPTIEHCVISYCDAAEWDPYLWAYGGGIACVLDSEAVIYDCIVYRNIAEGGGSVICEQGGTAVGGGIYCSSSCNVTVMNCVVAENQCRGGDGGPGDPPQCGAQDGGHAYGGGIFCAEGTIINCDVLNNKVVGGASAGASPGNANGGGIASGAAIVSDCIIRGNDAEQVYRYWAGDGPTVTYSNVEGGYSGTGNIDADPCFVSGLYGDYYLSQISAGQMVDSPCVDAGSDTAANLGMDEFTTRTDGWPDEGIIDMGYHYPLRLGSADIYRDWHVDFFDFDVLASQWQQAPGVPSADIAPAGLDGVVDGLDVWWLTECWLDCYVTAGSAPSPANGQSFADPNGILVWSAGEGAVYHDVYLGTDANTVGDANHLSGEFMGTVADANFDLSGLDLNTTYYWRVDECGPRCMTGGDVWSFTTWTVGPPNDPNLNLVSWWEFDEGSGTTAYDSAGGNDGTIVGAAWFYDPNNGWCLDFNGISDYVDLGSDSSLKPSLPVTIAGWVKLGGSGKIQRIISIDEQSPTYYGMWLQVDLIDKLHVGFGDGQGSGSQAYRRSKTGTTTLGIGPWYHVVAVIRGATDMEVYINGIDDGGSYSGSGGSLAYSSGDSSIGRENGAQYYFDGVIDDVRLYDRVLSASEVWQLYQDGL